MWDIQLNKVYKHLLERFNFTPFKRTSSYEGLKGKEVFNNN